VGDQWFNFQRAYAQKSNGKYLPDWAREKLSISKFFILGSKRTRSNYSNHN